MKLNQEIFDRIAAIDWFHNCGKPLVYENRFPIVYVKEWMEASEHFTEPVWEDVRWEARNDLTSYLHEHDLEHYNLWNQLVREVRDFVFEQIMPKIRVYQNAHALDEHFIDCVRMDIVNAVMEDAYKHCSGRPEYFLELLKVYESGNFPCGWDWENERLIVF